MSGTITWLDPYFPPLPQVDPPLPPPKPPAPSERAHEAPVSRPDPSVPQRRTSG
jgi:hypothetical protein